jgi:hypothetical protein
MKTVILMVQNDIYGTNDLHIIMPFLYYLGNEYQSSTECKAVMFILALIKIGTGGVLYWYILSVGSYKSAVKLGR